MRFSRLFGKTLKEKPSEADSISHQLLLRAGMVQQVAAGVYSYLPLGWRILKKIEQIIREEMDKAGGQELMMPTLQPFELWEQSERYPSFGKTLFTVTDRKEHVLVLGPTHEEVITDLVRRFVQSYRDLPLLLYQIQNKFRDEPRSRGGLLRVREFFMKDLYSFHADEASLDQTYQDMLQAYTNVYNRCGLPSVVVEADSGAIGGKESHEFMLVAETGEDEIIRCPKCGYAANVEKAQMTKPKAESTTPLPLEEIATPNIKTIEEVAKYVGIPASQTLKAVFYYADGQVVFAAIRGDLDINEVKLKNLLRAIDLRLATDIEVKAAGLVAGSASPIGIKEIKVIADDSITMGTNFVAGANKPDTHLKNMNYPRDFQVDLMADIAIVHPPDSCPRCQAKLVSQHGIEVGHVFKLGTFLSEKLGANFLDQNGTARPIIMGCYGIGLGRLLAAAVEQNHDEKGIIWPLSIAPYHIYLCSLQTDNAEVNDTAEKVYNDLIQENLEVLFDDRAESPGVKFNDADLLGIPLRLTVSPRTLQHQSIEVKWRNQKQAQLLPVGKTTSRIKDLLNQPPR
ncbi:MAG: proline--tRNA ligase [Chloroflexi bacterium]|nr:proline--tRNA ligase [Chloroflexota bacterium]